MKKNNYKFVKSMRILVIVLALGFSGNIHATSGSTWFSWFSSNYNKNYKYKKPKGCDSVPLDGGLGLLLAGAAIFGVKKLRENKNEQF